MRKSDGTWAAARAGGTVGKTAALCMAVFSLAVEGISLRAHTFPVGYKRLGDFGRDARQSRVELGSTESGRFGCHGFSPILGMWPAATPFTPADRTPLSKLG